MYTPIFFWKNDLRLGGKPNLPSFQTHPRDRALHSWWHSKSLWPRPTTTPGEVRWWFFPWPSSYGKLWPSYSKLSKKWWICLAKCFKTKKQKHRKHINWALPEKLEAKWSDHVLWSIPEVLLLNDPMIFLVGRAAVRKMKSSILLRSPWCALWKTCVSYHHRRVFVLAPPRVCITKSRKKNI